MWTWVFWRGVVERALRTVAQTLLVMWGGSELNVLQVDWVQTLSVAAGAGLLSVLMSLLPVGPKDSASWVEQPSAGRHAK